MAEPVSQKEIQLFKDLEAGNDAALLELALGKEGEDDGEDPPFDPHDTNAILVTDSPRNHVIAVGVGNHDLNYWYLANQWYVNRVFPVKVAWKAGEWFVSGVSPAFEMGFLSRLPSMARMGRVVFTYFRH